MKNKILMIVLLAVFLPFLGPVHQAWTVSQPSWNKKKVKLYMTSWCPYCQRMIQYLTENKIDYVAYDIEKDKKAEDEFRNYGGAGIPLIVVGKTVISGYDPEKVKAALE